METTHFLAYAGNLDCFEDTWALIKSQILGIGRRMNLIQLQKVKPAFTDESMSFLIQIINFEATEFLKQLSEIS